MSATHHTTVSRHGFGFDAAAARAHEAKLAHGVHTFGTPETLRKHATVPSSYSLQQYALPMEQQQGIDTKSDYYQGDFDYTTQPTQAERDNASHYKLSGFTDLTHSSDRQTAIEQAISSGLPVAVGFNARSSFENLNSSNYNYDPSPSEQVIGGHEVTIVGYDANGVTIENSWGSSWGDAGFFTAPWSWVTGSDVDEVNSMGKLVPTS